MGNVKWKKKEKKNIGYSFERHILLSVSFTFVLSFMDIKEIPHKKSLPDAHLHYKFYQGCKRHRGMAIVMQVISFYC